MPRLGSLTIRCSNQMDPTAQVVAVAVTLLAGSEILAMLPIRSNSWFQLLVAVLRGIVSTKTPPKR